MREKLGEAVGGLVAARLLERAEETPRADERRKEEEAERNEAMKSQRTMVIPSGLAEHQAQMERYKAQVARVDHEINRAYCESQGALPAGTILEFPEPPKPHNPGLPNRILGKATT